MENGGCVDEMENGGCVNEVSWKFKPNQLLEDSARLTVGGALTMIRSYVDDGDSSRPTIPLGHGDPSPFPCFRTTAVAEDAVVSALRSAHYNSYAPAFGILPARRAISEYLSRDLPYKLSPDDVFLTIGCIQSIEVALSALARPGSNILLPNPGYPYYEARAALTGIEVRHFNLVPERNWEVDLDAVESMADKNTVAMVIINPGNPCGNVFTYQHLAKIAETARKLGFMVISDEVYAHLVFGSNRFVPMGVFGSVVPVLTLGSISKRWVVPGWRCGWLVTNDPNGILKKTKCFDRQFLESFAIDYDMTDCGAIPEILGNTKEDFFSKINDILRQTADMCFDKLKGINGITCSCKPEGSMFVMVKLDVPKLEDISDDVDFCCKLAKEESEIILPGSVVGLKNWLRITFAVEPSSLGDGLARLESFCKRHAKKQ
ncbi:zinc-finger protein [Asimina triloba]